jgi:hypothetical protein
MPGRGDYVAGGVLSYFALLDEPEGLACPPAIHRAERTRVRTR